MRTSESTKELVGALSKAQGEFPKIIKDSENPYYKSKYADMASIVNAVQDPLAKQGLAVTQHLETDFQTYFDEDGTVKGEKLLLCVITRLEHISGEFEESMLRVPLLDAKPQTLGSASTYVKRYALQSILRVAAEEDDGNAASLQENWPKEKRDKYIEQKKLDLAKKPVKDQLEESLKVEPPKDEGRPDLTISAQQQKRLFAIAKSLGMSDQTIREALGACGYEHSREIPIDQYDKVIDFLDPDFRFHMRSKFQKPEVRQGASQ